VNRDRRSRLYEEGAPPPFLDTRRPRLSLILMRHTIPTGFQCAAVLAVALLLPAQGLLAEDKPLAAALKPFVDSHNLAGAVMLVADENKVLDLETVGYADVAAKAEMKPDTLFWIASMTKAMTAAGVMVLVDEGKVKLEDPVEKYLPEFHGQMVAAERDENHVLLKKSPRPITVKDVLCHVSGLVNQSPLEAQAFDVLSVRDLCITYGLSPLQFEPGSKWSYNNPGINTAGRIIEVASGMPYEQFMSQRLFEPLGMKETTFFPTEEQLKRLAKTYKANAAKDGLEESPIQYLTYPLSDRTKRHAFPGGGLFSTAADVSAFCRMLLGNGTFEGKKILSEAAVAAMTSTQTAPGLVPWNKEGGYGLGLLTESRANGTFWHGGAYKTLMRVDREHHRISVLMVQMMSYPMPEGEKVEGTFVNTAAGFGK
jgi:CubicO group peptidase (beta-lactamase class C family)